MNDPLDNLLYPIYSEATNNDLIKMGVIDLDLSTYHESKFDSFLNKYQHDIDVLISTDEIDSRILERISTISKLKSFNEIDNIFGKNLVDSTLLALRAFCEKFEGHLNQQLYFKLMNDLFYDYEIYAVSCQSELRANKKRKNDFKPLNSEVLKALRLDIKIN
nr:9462_t:CDS:2 [Entrophospora candida]